MEEWIASSQALPCANASRLSQAMTLRQKLAFPRREAPEVCMNSSPHQNRGRRECRALDAPAASHAVFETKHTSVVTTVTPEITRHSPRNGFTASFVLSPAYQA